MLYAPFEAADSACFSFFRAIGDKLYRDFSFIIMWQVDDAYSPHCAIASRQQRRSMHAEISTEYHIWHRLLLTQHARGLTLDASGFRAPGRIDWGLGFSMQDGLRRHYLIESILHAIAAMIRDDISAGAAGRPAPAAPAFRQISTFD